MPDNREKFLLTADAVFNLALGIFLLIFPKTILNYLGIPITFESFYARILGAVLLGIGFALLLERCRDRFGYPGLGIGGAILINICGAGALAVLLLFSRLDIPLRGQIILWFIALIVMFLSVIEMLTLKNRTKET